MSDDAFSLLAAARAEPSTPALITRDCVLTYGDVAIRVRRTAAWLAKDPRSAAGVAVVADVRPETLVVLYALFELGLPAVLIHPRATAHERRRLMETARVSLVVDESFADEPLPDRDDGDLGTRAPIGEESPLAILFTSGTSGKPKGVELSRRAFRASANASRANLGWTRDDRWLLCMPIAHVGGLSVVVRCLAARRPVVLAPWTGELAHLLDDVERHRVTMLSLVPTMLARIFDDFPDYRFPAHVRVVLVGGDATTSTLLAEAARRRAPVLTTYGMTEACSQVATRSPSRLESPEHLGSESTDVGKPLDGVEVRIHDGEIQVRGATMMTGYFPRDASPDPFVDGGWFPSGDLGRFDDEGRLHVIGRRTDRIVTGGENVDPLEVERVLLACDGVASACVFGVTDARWGQTVAAALVAREPGAPPDPRLVAEHVVTSLASFKRPRAIAFCDAFVTNPSGKVDRAKTGQAVTPRLVPLVAAPREA